MVIAVAMAASNKIASALCCSPPYGRLVAVTTGNGLAGRCISRTARCLSHTAQCTSQQSRTRKATRSDSAGKIALHIIDRPSRRLSIRPACLSWLKWKEMRRPVHSPTLRRPRLLNDCLRRRPQASEQCEDASGWKWHERFEIAVHAAQQRSVAYPHDESIAGPGVAICSWFIQAPHRMQSLIFVHPWLNSSTLLEIYPLPSTAQIMAANLLFESPWLSAYARRRLLKRPCPYDLAAHPS